jgi:hypothetical protein
MNTEIVKLNKNQNGGEREGAGRKTGSSNKLRVTDFFNGAERDELIANAKLLAFGDLEQGIKPDKDMIKFCWEQLFGKATQRTILEDDDGNKFTPLLVKILRDNGANSN